jgi:organic hydroperoxide reductase OsmC/OhrA
MPEARQHRYQVHTRWSGETRGYDGYAREHVIEVPDKPTLRVSADPAFLGDASCHNPEDLLVAALSSCHMLWYLHLCAAKGIVVTGYEDAAEGTMEEAPHGGRFTLVVLRPVVTITEARHLDRAQSLHERAHAACFIANSVSFPVRCEPAIHPAQPAPADRGSV